MKFIFGRSAATSENSTFGVFLPDVAYKKAGQEASVKRTLAIHGAVYSHMQAMRALGHKKVNTEQVAKALSLPLSEVDEAIKGMKEKGVRLASK